MYKLISFSVKILPHPNGELMEPSQHSRDKHHRSTRVNMTSFWF